MKKTIAVTGVGGGVGQCVLKSLANTDYNLIALDGEPLAAGLYMGNDAELIPYASTEEYIPRLLSICEEKKVSLLFPGLDAELLQLSLNRQKFKKIGTTVVVSDPNVIKISDDKQETYNQLRKIGVSIPFTGPLDSFNADGSNFPVIVKPKIGGARSKDVYFIIDKAGWESLLENIKGKEDDFIVMDYIDGDEYTCGTVNLDNSCKGVIIMRRILRSGDTHKSFVEKNDIIEQEVRKVVESIKPFGGCNVQLRFKDNTPYIFEINARCSGTTAARTLSGFNEPKMIADYLLQGIEPAYTIKEQTILRYWNELVVDNDEVEKMYKKK